MALATPHLCGGALYIGSGAFDLIGRV